MAEDLRELAQRRYADLLDEDPDNPLDEFILRMFAEPDRLTVSRFGSSL